MRNSEPSDIAPEVVAALEAILLVAVEPVSVKLLAQVLEQPTAVVEVLCNRLAASYDEAGHGFQLVKVAGGMRLQTRPELSPYVERFVLDGQQSRVSSAALETLAIIAYKQPISRQQISAIRGVDPESVLRTLQARGYITETSRDDGPGLAVLYGTTPLFLERLGVNSLEDLPPISDFVPDAGVVEALEAGLRVVPDATTATADVNDSGLRLQERHTP
ncbi:MAG: SMC-Scp complex subunit ScpB [Actinobacteria bacterium]|nr:SMC-Scp complex subunit ScpB [Actinomycetota bacterium]NBP17452.1 SMC-Scp complex subunit ScpB [Actinomycetota bacterium]